MKQTLFHTALTNFQQGNLLDAQRFTEESLRQTPNHADSLKLLAVLMFHLGKYTKTLDFLNKLGQQIPLDEETLNLKASALLELQRYPLAEEIFLSIYKNNSQHSSVLFNLGLVYLRQSKLQQAADMFAEVLNNNPQHEQALCHLGQVFLSQNQTHQAMECFHRALNINPYNSIACNNLAYCHLLKQNFSEIDQLLTNYQQPSRQNFNIQLEIANLYLNKGYLEQAIKTYKHLLINYQNEIILYRNLGLAFELSHETELAIDYYQQAISLAPESIAAKCSLGNLYSNMGLFDEAEKYLSQALQQAPDQAAVYINFGRLYNHQRQYLKSREYYLKALSLEPNNAAIHYNLGNNYRKTGDYQHACTYLTQCLQLDPNFANAEHNLGLNELAMGKFDTAWRHYFKRMRFLNGETLSPITPGMNLQGKKIYLRRSQGIGDELFFLRFLPLLKEQHVHISYRASNKIFPLIQDLPEIDVLLHEQDAIPEADFYFSIDDLPLILDIDKREKIPAPLALEFNQQLTQQIQQQTLSHYPPPYIGLTWKAGTPLEQQDTRSLTRSLVKEIDLSELIPILAKTKASIVVLQRNCEEQDLKLLQQSLPNPVLDLSSYNENLPHMLALMTLLDDYVGVSNTNMHLCAAVAKTARVLVPHPAEWRWMISGNNSPWFPEFCIYRQDCNFQWQTACNNLESDLIKNYG